MAQLRTPRRVVVVHYSPIAGTVQGEAPEIFPFLGTTRLAEVVDRHGADLVLHGHAHHGQLEGKTIVEVLFTTWQSRCCRHNSRQRIGCLTYEPLQPVRNALRQ